MQAERLAAEYGVAGILDFFETERGLVKANVTLAGMRAEFYLQGAHITAWQPYGDQPIIFTSPNSAFEPGRAIRGGIPVIFPWFGASQYGAAAPQHGFARTALWNVSGVQIIDPQSIELTFTLGQSDVGSPFWSEPFHAIYTVRFGRELSIALAVQNRAKHSIIFEEALHTYFAISDIAAVGISGLGGNTYIDKTDSGIRKVQTETILTLTGENDSVYLKTPPQCAIEDSGWHRKIIIEKNGASSSVVWNPWRDKAVAMEDLGDPVWRRMVCVETGNIADDKVRLAADSEHHMSTVISTESLERSRA